MQNRNCTDFSIFLLVIQQGGKLLDARMLFRLQVLNGVTFGPCTPPSSLCKVVYLPKDFLPMVSLLDGCLGLLAHKCLVLKPPATPHLHSVRWLRWLCVSFVPMDSVTLFREKHNPWRNRANCVFGYLFKKLFLLSQKTIRDKTYRDTYRSYGTSI